MLDSTQLESFERDGYVVLGTVLDSDERAELIAAERRLRPSDGYGTSPGLIVMDQLAHVSSAVRRFCCDGRHLDAVVQLLGPDVALTHNQFVVKLPGKGIAASEIPLHQDDGYGLLDPPDDLTVWVALTDAAAVNGCLVLAPGSHHGGLVEHMIAASNPAFREARADDIMPLELAAGEAVAFSGLLLHGSGDNLSDVERVGLFARYCTPTARMMTEAGKPVLDDGNSWMVRGEAPLSTWRSANTKYADESRRAGGNDERSR
jgi:ectoine hydroxylase-related dioxygenase (phytanoyl-CoA dioxygenase family)